jgi:hypothetical protein
MNDTVVILNRDLTDVACLLAQRSAIMFFAILPFTLALTWGSPVFRKDTTPMIYVRGSGR